MSDNRPILGLAKIARPLPRRAVWGLIPAFAASSVAAALLLHPSVNHPVVAQDGATLTAQQMSVATSLEGAFMRIADTVGPANRFHFRNGHAACNEKACFAG